MNNVKIEVSKTIQGNFEDVKRMIWEIDNYPKWWKDFNIQNQNFPDWEFDFKPLPFTRIRLKRITIDQDNFIEFNYVKGPFRGTGKWEVFKTKESRNIEIRYTIDLKPTNFIFGLIAATPCFRKIHTKDIRKLICKIEKQISMGD